jgi:DNA polymerase
MGVDPYTKKWKRQSAYGGLLCENVVQATARDLMAYAMPKCEEKGYECLLTVHDEVICRSPKGHGSVKEFEGLVASIPPWAAGLPLKAEGWAGSRYRK